MTYEKMTPLRERMIEDMSYCQFWCLKILGHAAT